MRSNCSAKNPDLMKPAILALTPFYKPTLDALECDYILHKLWEAPDPDALIKRVASNVRGIVTTGLLGCKRAHIDALPKLEVIACFGTSHGSLDLPAAKERGIVVTNTPDWTVDAVADLAIGLLIAVMRRIGEADRFIRAGKWSAGAFPMSTDLRGKTCGIIGYGGIGSAVAKRVTAFGMSVCYHGPREKPGVAHPYFADLLKMAQAVECLIVTCPETPATRKSVDARILDALGAQGFLVNVARGAIVDEAALIQALKEGRIAGAGLEVFWDEPRVPSELLAMEQVVLAPHIGSSTREIREHRGATLLANLRAHFAGEPVPDRLA
jgi:lactate dehydrogenase-like 2-hydroxyacid dehydrogenase